MDTLLTSTGGQVLLGLAYFLNSVFWAYLYFRLRNKVKQNEIAKGAHMDEAAETIQNRAASKVKKAYAMGVLRGLTHAPNLVIKETTNGRT